MPTLKAFAGTSELLRAMRKASRRVASAAAGFAAAASVGLPARVAVPRLITIVKIRSGGSGKILRVIVRRGESGCAKESAPAWKSNQESEATGGARFNGLPQSESIQRGVRR